ncbi:uncharacterized protein LOC131053396 isoform X2 [Cryptomeria japonica]|nr:uncharacterized protein LOC131053396 isoform X2 [Cryptomeria japonica]
MQKHPHNPMQKRCETINGKAGQYKWLTYQEVYNMVLKIGSGLRSCGIEHISERSIQSKPFHSLQVGDDEFGHMLVVILRENGVNDRGLLFDNHARTTLTFVTVHSDEERKFMFFRNPSVDMLLTEVELDRDLIQHFIQLVKT